MLPTLVVNNVKGAPGSTGGLRVPPGILRQSFRERRPFDELHYQRAKAAAFLEAVDRRDVRMIQGCQQPRLTRESRKAFRIAGEE